jgi:hypothetical protein
MVKILIWGTGYYAQKLMEDGVNAEIVGFVESEKSKDIFKGCKVFTPKDTLPNCDLIIVANIYPNEIYDSCIQNNIDISKVVFLKNISRLPFNGRQEVEEVLGEKNYVEYAREYGVWKGTFVETDLTNYNNMNKRNEFVALDKYMYPIIYDKYRTNSGFNSYFWQDLWAAKHIITRGVKEHYDIGSRVDGFIAHLLASNIKVNMIDIRKFEGKAENLYTIVDDATMMKQFKDDSIPSLSALCSLEHFGLGRYGDPVDPEACFLCFEQIQRKLKKGGRVYLSVPIGHNHVEFNAHRVFTASTIVESMNLLKLVEYSVIKDKSIEYNVDIHKYDDLGDKHLTGLFLLEK